MRRRLLLVAKFSVGLALLAALLLRGDTASRVGRELLGLRLEAIPAVIAVGVVLTTISCLKWKIFLDEAGHPVSLSRLLSLYSIGVFFNNFLPGMVGGDVVRGWTLGRRIDSNSRAMASVFMERFSGLVALVTLGVASLSMRPHLLQDAAVRAAVILLGGVCLGGIAAILFPGVARALLAPVRRLRFAAKAIGTIERFHDDVSFYGNKPRVLVAAIAYSFLFHVTAGFNVFVAAWALGHRLDLLEVLALTPLILLVSSVPVTPNGLGVWEWAFSVLLVPAGATPDAGLAAALVLRAQSLLTSIIGGIFFLAERSTRRQHGAEATGRDAPA